MLEKLLVLIYAFLFLSQLNRIGGRMEWNKMISMKNDTY
jgi:hypothetical protein